MEFDFRELGPADAEAALPAILGLVRAEAGRAGSFLHVQEAAFYSRLLSSDGVVFAAYRGSELVGFAALGLGPLVHPLWRPYLEPRGVDPAAVGVCVHHLIDPRWRGREIGRRLHAMRLLHAGRRGLTDLVATVHPDNLPIQRICGETGFVEIDRREVYEARVPRILLHRALGRPALDAPRVKLCRLPTAIEELPRLGAALGGPRLFVKRDDGVGLATGGNKSRMLEYLLADALQRGARTLITRGHALSNHCRQTAAAAARLGLGCRLVLRGAPAGPSAGNEFLDRLLGAEITWTRDRDPDVVLAEVCAEAERAGQSPYAIAYGGAQALGAAAYAEALREIVDAGERFDRIVVAASSGATQAGLVAGAILEGAPVRIMGVSIDEEAAALRPKIARLAGDIGRLYGVGPLPVAADQIDVDARLARGYAMIGPEEREALALFARTEGLLLDPVYTARAAAVLIAQCRRGEIGADERVLFLHTGGLPSLFALSGAVFPEEEPT